MCPKMMLIGWNLILNLFFKRFYLRQDFVCRQLVCRFIHDICRPPVLSTGNVSRRLCHILDHLLRGSGQPL